MKRWVETLADVPRVIGVVRAAHAESRFADMPYDAEKLLASLEGLVDLQQSGNYYFEGNTFEKIQLDKLVFVAVAHFPDNPPITR